MSEERNYLSVSELNARIKYLLEGDEGLGSVFLRAEISNFKVYPSGHAYFTLKDEGSMISAIMWASSLAYLKFRPDNGDKVLVHGKITVYPPKGNYQLTVASMQKDGEGEERKRLRELALKLKKEGLFDESKKRALPLIPRRIAIIAGRGSAGMRDIEVNLAKRWPLAEVLAFPSLVQGKEAPADLMENLEKAKKAKPDVLIIGRGGGSSEDLGAFNDEALVRALSSFPVPSISAVGHEIDVTLTDLVADRRVSTPTAAAIACVPDQYEVMQRLDDMERKIDSEMSSVLNLARERVEKYLSKPYFKNPKALYSNEMEKLYGIGTRLDNGMKNILELKGKELSYASSRLKPLSISRLGLCKERLKSLDSRLEALNPEKVLNRGYSITLTSDGKPLRSKKQLSVGETIRTRLKDGIIVSKITEKED